MRCSSTSDHAMPPRLAQQHRPWATSDPPLWRGTTTIVTLPDDNEDIACACARHGVHRLRVFGSILTGHFVLNISYLDFVVEFEPGVGHPFDAHLGLHEELESLLARRVDVVLAEAVRKPCTATPAFDSALDADAA